MYSVLNYLLEKRENKRALIVLRDIQELMGLPNNLQVLYQLPSIFRVVTLNTNNIHRRFLH